MKAYKQGRSWLYSYGRIITRCFPKPNNRSHALHLLHSTLHIDKRVNLLSSHEYGDVTTNVH